MSCECDCASCTEFCDCQRCSKPENDLLAPPNNRPGLDAIVARIGDFGAFFTDAKRQLSSKESPNLQTLGTRDPTDPTIAFLDAWSIALDVLTFYRERLTQEGYLRTATDERSLRELANLVGFKPRPGIAATAHLAYLLDPSAKPVDIDPGTRVQTVPGPGEKMQSFETDKKLSARAEWSQIKPRQTRPPNIDILYALMQTTIRLTDTSLGVRPGERVLFIFEPNPGMPNQDMNSMRWTVRERVVREVLSAKANIELGFLEITLKPRDGLVQALAEKKNIVDNKNLVEQILGIQSEIAKVSETPVSEEEQIRKFLLNVISSYFLGTDATGVLSLLDPAFDTRFLSSLRDLPIGSPFAEEIKELNRIFTAIAKSTIPEIEELKATSIDDTLSVIRNTGKGNVKSNGFQLQEAKGGLDSNGVVRIEMAQAMQPVFQDSLTPALGVIPASPVPKSAPSVYLLRAVMNPFGAVAPKNISSSDGEFSSEEWLLDASDKIEGAAFLETVADSVTADSFGVLETPLFSWGPSPEFPRTQESVSPQRLFRFARIRSTQTVARGSYNISSKVTRLEFADADSGEPLTVIPSDNQIL